MYDVIIVGGGAAGLSAALTLGRFRRQVLICDRQTPRNAAAEVAHNFFTRDGTPPSELLRIGREQLRPYDTVEHRLVEVVGVQAVDGGFELQTAVGEPLRTAKLLLATGVRDKLPAIDGLADYWAKGVYHCPYCHGWEARDQQIVILGDGQAVFHLASLLSALSDDISACLLDGAELDAAQAQQLHSLGVKVYAEGVTAVEGDGSGVTAVRLSDGRVLPCQSIFVRTEPEWQSPFVQELGCELMPSGHVKVDVLGRTSVANLYAAGDMVTPLQQLVAAAASGMAAGSGINTDLAFGSVSH